MPEEKSQVQQEIVWGRNSVLALIEEAPNRVKKILVAKGAHHQSIRRIQEACRACGIPLQQVDRLTIERNCPGVSHQGVVALISPAELHDVAELVRFLPDNSKPGLVLLLDHLQDPGNLGSVLRSAEAFGASAVVIPKRRAALPTGTVLKASAGAAARIPIVTSSNLLSALDRLEPEGFWSVAMDPQATEPLDGRPLPARMALVVGSEGFGISRPVENRCDERRKIPMGGASGSLNAAVAASIAMYVWKRAIDKAGGAP
ncbi:MAG: 23S rRNA (guanosine(2251)-2'-O)-methyltransferase RlmB [Synergistaceae bacterium]|jgi:23S rRNA (guanosine2251-2'-O)-methyltransferase|nr:23S rRNA (guanosine(2251)-2'-O)-methyltransferase RlmB [Synergistaceae bacterium]